MQNPNVPPGAIPIQMGPGGQMPTPQQIAAMQQQLAAEAQKHGMTVPQFVEHIKAQRLAQLQAAQRQQQQQGGQGPQGGPQGPQGPPRPPPGAQGQPQPIRPGPPNPVAISLANFLRSQTLKQRTCILNGERKDMFRVKRALRALQSPAYAKARAKNPALPEVTDRASLENTFKLLPLSMLALRVSKIDPHEGHDHPPKKGKRVKGLWTVKIEQQQDAGDDMYYVWLYEGSQIMRKVYAALALLVIFTVVLYPLWPLVLRQGVYYLSWGFLMLLGLFFLMAIFRVILFCITYFVVPPGLWLYPNLWEDVSFMDSFRPVWAWHETAKPKKKRKASKSVGAESAAQLASHAGHPPPATATTTATETQIQTEPQQRAYVAPRVEELADDE
ncbi:Translocation protein SEC62 [Daldinia childiae]|uniref:Translocation protein SEC62 n=1 Tax=Daldinia childiae TaxID=326645 RepID=UPI0014453F93|nr:Translocation protein SEC62 [Daldinia childiae]KAF3061822.1 Translocation protein SEC62 [Daldinia childiae]